MEGEERLYFRIRPKNREEPHDRLVGRLERLDEVFTESLPGGVGDYDHERSLVEVWLFDEQYEPMARRLIEENGFEVVLEEEVEPEE